MSTDATLIEKGLGNLRRCVGNTPDAGAYVFTSLNLSDDADNKVSDLSSVTKFTELRQVSVNNQNISDLTPLASLPFLAVISCKNNRLESSLDALTFRLCKKPQDGIADTGEDFDAAWAAGDRSIGSVLTSADLSSNLIRGPLGDHRLHRFLRRLNIGNNVLGEVGQGLSKLTELKYLNLSRNQLKCVNIGDLPASITELDLSSNDLEDLGFVSSLLNLEVLVIDQNRLSSTRSLCDCPELRVFSIRNNALSDFNCVENLEDSENLQALSIQGNPLSAVEFIHLRVINLLPQLTSLEGKIILSEERVKSQILLGKDHPRRMHCWDRHLGTEFVDTMPYFEENEDYDRLRIENAIKKAAVQVTGKIAESAIGNVTPRKE